MLCESLFLKLNEMDNYNIAAESSSITMGIVSDTLVKSDCRWTMSQSNLIPGCWAFYATQCHIVFGKCTSVSTVQTQQGQGIKSKVKYQCKQAKTRTNHLEKQTANLFSQIPMWSVMVRS